MSPATIPVIANVPVEFEVAVVIVPSVKDPIVVDPKLALVMFGPAVPPISRVPTVTMPVLLIVADSIVPIVFVPVEEVNPVAKVVTPLILGIVAVEIVAVEIVAVLAERVPIVAVPVDIVTLVPNVTGPSWRGIVAVLIVAVLIVAVLIVAVLMLAVAIVAVPVDAVM